MSTRISAHRRAHPLLRRGCDPSARLQTSPPRHAAAYRNSMLAGASAYGWLSIWRPGVTAAGGFKLCTTREDEAALHRADPARAVHLGVPVAEQLDRRALLSQQHQLEISANWPLAILFGNRRRGMPADGCRLVQILDACATCASSSSSIGRKDVLAAMKSTGSGDATAPSSIMALPAEIPDSPDVQRIYLGRGVCGWNPPPEQTTAPAVEVT